MRSRSPATLSLVVVLTAALLLAGVAGAEHARAPVATKITSSGAGGVKLGKKFSKIRRQGLVGPLRPGCELARNTRSAKLKSPLKGSVNFTRGAGPRRVHDILVRGGATARGVGVGSSKAEIKDAFRKARFDHSTEQVFRFTLVRIPKNGGGKLQMAVDIDSKKVTLIGIPLIALCE